MKYHNTGAAAAARARKLMINRQETPDRKTTINPELAINNAVPRSGCLAINKAGTAIITSAKNHSDKAGGNGLSAR